MRNFIIIILSTLISISNENEIFNAMQDELDRSMSELSIEGLEKPYFIEYKVNKINSNVIEASLGALVDSQTNNTASLDVDVRVGDYAFDNTNFFDIGLSFFGSSDDEERFKIRQISNELDYNYLRRELWLATDAAYKQSAEIYSKKIAALKNRIRKDTTKDFMKAEKTTGSYLDKVESFNLDYFEALVKDLSAVFKDYPAIHSSSVLIEYSPQTTYYLNTEGTKYTKNEFYVGLEIVASGQSDDGMPSANYFTAYARYPSDMPSKDSLKKAAIKVAEILTKTLEAEAINDDYSGPLIFSGRAAGEIFAQKFASNLVVQREPVSEGGFSSGSDATKAFQTKIGGRVLPEFLSVDLNPTNKDLIGYFMIDDNGSKPMEKTLVKNGYLKNLVSERIPTKRVRENLGHKRGGAAMYSNLILKVDENIAVSYDSLKSRMMQLCKDRELEYGIVVKNIINQNIFRTTLFSQDPGLFGFQRGDGKYITAEIYKVYPDGREEICRGLSGKALTARSFKDIINVSSYNSPYQFLANSVISPFLSGGSQYLPSSVLVPDMLIEDAELSVPTQDFKKVPVINNPISNK